MAGDRTSNAATSSTARAPSNGNSIDTGTRRLVLVQMQEGRFEPREVELGARGENFIEIIKGVKDGEQVVVAANFLIDAESNLKAAISGFSSAPPAAPAKSKPTPAGGDDDWETF